MLADPAVYDRLQAELDEAYPDCTTPFRDGELARIPLLDAVIYEALRFGSPYYLPRIVPPKGVTIDGTFIPGDTIVALSAFSQQTSSENFFPDPLVSFSST